MTSPPSFLFQPIFVMFFLQNPEIGRSEPRPNLIMKLRPFRQIPFSPTNKLLAMEKEDPALTLHRKQMAQYSMAVSIQARKIEKKPKEETPQEMYRRISEQKESKKIKSAKSGAKSLVKRKKMKSMNAYFAKK